jgi:AmmeMemoRadiSam system protein B
MAVMKRKPYVAGTFYPGQKDRLRETIERLVSSPPVPRKKALAVIAPHAGYEYSGRVAGAVFASAEIPGTVVVLGPGHRDIGSLFAVQKEGSWLSPLGETPIQKDLASSILEFCPAAREDERSHLWEHSLEVELPFIQYFASEAALVPVCVSYQAEFGDLEALGRGLAGAIKAFGRPVLIVASTDMSHYVSQATAEAKDGLAIRKVLDLDPRGLYDTVRDHEISMCGYQPATAALVAARELGAAKAELVLYQTSGERTGDYAQVVGYAGIRIS